MATMNPPPRLIVPYDGLVDHNRCSNYTRIFFSYRRSGTSLRADNQPASPAKAAAMVFIWFGGITETLSPEFLSRALAFCGSKTQVPVSDRALGQDGMHLRGISSATSN